MHANTKQRMAELVATPSISCTLPQLDLSNLPVIELLATWFTSAGFSCEIMPVADGKANLIATKGKEYAQHGAGLVLSGHTDTVPIDEALWDSNPFVMREEANKLYGIGIADMKSFFAFILEVVETFKNTPFKAPLIVVATCDEETSMAGARALVKQGQAKGRFALIGEPTNLIPARTHKGVLLERILITGQAGHSSNPDAGKNAIDAMHDMIGELRHYRNQLKNIQNPVFNVPYTSMSFGCIHGGDNPNRICGLCELQFDIRPLPHTDTKQLRGEIQQLVDQVKLTHGVDILYESASLGSPAVETNPESPFVKMVEKLTGSEAGSVGFGTEAPFFKQLGMDTIILGAGSIDQAHQPNEYIAIDQVQPMVNILTKLIQHYCVEGHATPLA